MDRYRTDLIRYLFLPLDSWMFNSVDVFEDGEVLFSNGLTRSSTMGNVRTKGCYVDLQNYLLRRAQDIEQTLADKFHRIYFELFWRNRYRKPGDNLFLTNL